MTNITARTMGFYKEAELTFEFLHVTEFRTVKP